MVLQKTNKIILLSTFYFYKAINLFKDILSSKLKQIQHSHNIIIIDKVLQCYLFKIASYLNNLESLYTSNSVN